jgi:hypothetical protein
LSSAHLARYLRLVFKEKKVGEELDVPRSVLKVVPLALMMQTELPKTAGPMAYVLHLL